jgi:tetratricopeptide (TPR) repeat protein
MKSRRFIFIFLTGLFAMCAVVASTSAQTAAASPAPKLSLRLVGVESDGALPSPVRGLHVEVEAAHPGVAAGGTAPLVLAAPGGASWAERVSLRLVSLAGNRESTAPWKLAPLPAGRARAELTTRRAAFASFTLPSAAVAALAPGRYRVEARLALRDGEGWRGEVSAPPVEFSISPAPAPAVLTLVRDVLEDARPYPAGWPLIVRTVQRFPENFPPRDAGAVAPTLEVRTEAGGASLAWPWQMFTQARGVLVERVFLLDQTASGALAPGRYRLSARQPGDTQETALALEIAAAPATPTADDAALLRALKFHAAMHTGRFDEAEKLARAAYVAEPEAAATFFNFAQLARARGDRALALGFLDVAKTRYERNKPPRAARLDGESSPHDSLAPPPFEFQSLRAQLLAMPDKPPGPASRAVLTSSAPSPPPPQAAPAPSTSPAPRPSTAPAAPPSAPAAETGVRWAASARASSEYGATDWGAVQAAGAPNAGSYGDRRQAWTTRSQNVGETWLELAYEPAVERATGVRVFQNFNPGALIRIELITPDGSAATVWTGPDTTSYVARQIGIFQTRFPPSEKPVAKVKLTLDTARLPGWKQIDAVGVLTSE